MSSDGVVEARDIVLAGGETDLFSVGVARGVVKVGPILDDLLGRLGGRTTRARLLRRIGGGRGLPGVLVIGVARIEVRQLLTSAGRAPRPDRGRGRPARCARDIASASPVPGRLMGGVAGPVATASGSILGRGLSLAGILRCDQSAQ